MKSTTYKLIILLGVLFTSFSSIIVKGTTAPAIIMVMLRTGFAALIMVPFVIKDYKDFKSLTKKEFFLCVLSGFFLSLHFLTYFSSIKYTTISSATIIVNTEVFFVALLAFILFKTKPSKKAMLGIIVSFIGSIIIALEGGGENATAVLLGNSLALLGAILGAVYTIIGVMCRETLSTNVYTFILYSACSVSAFFIALFTKTPLTGYESINIFYGLLLAIFPTILGHTVYSWGLKFLNPTFIATAKLMEPVCATTLAIFIFSQVPSIKAILGGILVIGGVLVFISVKEDKQKEPLS